MYSVEYPQDDSVSVLLEMGLGAQIPDHVLFGVRLEIGIVRVVVEIAAVYARGVGDGLVVGVNVAVMRQ
ncbi:MAG: hypothetical protein ACLRMJ_08655 [Alistipes finegoldii]